MSESITPDQIRLKNTENIYRYIYTHRRSSQQELSYDLHLSRPTIASNLKWMEEKGLVRKEGQVDTGLAGRKAAAYVLAPAYRISMGLQILQYEVKMVIIDLLGHMIRGEIFPIRYRKEDSYFRAVSEKVLQFLESAAYDPSQVLGVGIAIQGLTSPDGRSIVYGKILDCNGLTAEVFEQYLPFSCLFVHDSFSAATSELWASPDLRNAFYLSICDHLGAALISEGKISLGMHGHNATIEHYQVVPNGKPCYCGNRGCLETLVSVDALLEDGETLSSFFEAVRNGSPDESARWDRYLNHLGKMLAFVLLIYDARIILGGDLAAHFIQEDINRLYGIVRNKIPFDDENDYILLSKMPLHGITIGASLPFIFSFLEHPCS